jgi:hypothetical protein
VPRFARADAALVLVPLNRSVERRRAISQVRNAHPPALRVPECCVSGLQAGPAANRCLRGTPACGPGPAPAATGSPDAGARPPPERGMARPPADASHTSPAAPRDGPAGRVRRAQVPRGGNEDAPRRLNALNMLNLLTCEIRAAPPDPAAGGAAATIAANPPP